MAASAAPPAGAAISAAGSAPVAAGAGMGASAVCCGGGVTGRNPEASCGGGWSGAGADACAGAAGGGSGGGGAGRDSAGIPTARCGSPGAVRGAACGAAAAAGFAGCGVTAAAFGVCPRWLSQYPPPPTSPNSRIVPSATHTSRDGRSASARGSARDTLCSRVAGRGFSSIGRNGGYSRCHRACITPDPLASN